MSYGDFCSDNMASVRDVLLAQLVWTGANIMTCLSEEINTSNTMDYSDFTEPPDYGDYVTPCLKTSNRQFRSWFMPTFYTLICLLGLGGNALVILTYFHFNRLKTMTDVYLLNLSFADFLFALSLPFWAANSMVEWPLGLGMCRTIHTVYKVSFYSSMILLSLISVDRYYAITKAVSAHRHRSKTVIFSKVSSAIVWVMALIFSTPEMIYTAVNNKTCSVYSSNASQLIVGIQVSQMVLGFSIPLLIMGFCYCVIIRTLCQAKKFESNKAIKVIFAVVAVFLLCQVPYNLVLLMNTLITVHGGNDDCSYDNSLLYASDVTQCVAFLRCCLNPFVYAFVGVKFRLDLLKLMKDLGCMSQETFFKYTCGRRSSSSTVDTDTITTFSP